MHGQYRGSVTHETNKMIIVIIRFFRSDENRPLEVLVKASDLSTDLCFFASS